MKTFFGLLVGIPRIVLAACAGAAILLVAIGIFRGGTAIHELFAENAALKKSLANLTREEKIGYAKVIDQKLDASGRILSTDLKFVETARDNQLEIILEKQYTIQGDIIHFDALIVKFDTQMVASGEKKSLYLWRRVYGERQTPEDGYPIEINGKEPDRYSDLLDQLPIRHRNLFWSSIWELANDPYKLRQYGVEAIYGNATYARVKPGLLYVFRITATGQVYPEVIPDI